MSRSEDVELKPCPFCGGEAEIERYGTPRMSTIYRCTNCGASLETGEEWDHGTAWNTRAPSASPPSTLQKVQIAPQPEPVSGWRDIATAPPYRVPVLLIAQYPTKTGWTDIYHGWRNAGGSNWDRWPHDFRPTHWMPLPSPPSEPGVK